MMLSPLKCDRGKLNCMSLILTVRVRLSACLHIFPYRFDPSSITVRKSGSVLSLDCFFFLFASLGSHCASHMIVQRFLSVAVSVYLCPCFYLRTRNSIRGFVRPSVGPSVGPSVRDDRVGKCEMVHFRPCPPVRNWYWSCIRPCSFQDRALITIDYI